MALDLGTLVAHLGLDASAVTSGASQANQAFSQVQTGSEQTGNRLDGLKKKLGAALAVGALVAFGKASVEAFAEAEQSQLKLQSAFEKFPKLADSNIAAITGIAEALAQKTQFDDDATKAAAAQLAQFNLTGKQIEQVIPLVQDYAARTGKDLPAAATSLGKAFLGQTRSLKEVGINYKSTGDQATDYANIVELLGEKVGGFAEQQGKTTAGQLDILENNFGELKEAVGQAILPIAGGLVDAAGAALSVITPLAGVVGDFITSLVNLDNPVLIAAAALTGLAILGPKILTFLRALPALAVKGGAALTASLGPVGLVLGTVTAAIALFGGGNADAEARVEAHTAAVEKLKASIDGSTGSFNDAALGMFAEKFAGFGKELGQVGVTVGTATGLIIKGADDGGKSWEELRQKVASGIDVSGVIASSSFVENAVAEMAETTGRSTDDVVKSIAAGGEAQAGLLADLAAKGGLSAYEYQMYINDTRARIEEYAPAVAIMRKEVEEAAGAQRAATDAVKAEAEAQAAATQAVQDGAETRREGSRGLRDYAADAAVASEASRESAAASRDAAFDADAYSAAVAAAGKATQDTRSDEEQAAEMKSRLAGEQDILNGRYEAAQAAAETGAEGLTTFEQAAQDASDAQSELATKVDEVTATLDRQAGRVPTLEEANAKAAETGDALAESFKLGTDEAEKLGAAILNTDGTVKTADEGGRQFRQGILDTRDAMATQAQAAYDLAIAQGGSVVDATKAAKDAQADSYQQFITTATAILGSEAAAKRAATAYGLIPSDVASTITATDLASGKAYDAKRALESLAQQSYNATVGLDTSALDAQIASANAKLSALGRSTASRVGPVQLHAFGGAVVGPGTGTSDSIDARLSNGEHVIPANEVDAAGGQRAIYRLRQVIRAGDLPRYATGGAVGVNVGALSGIDSRSLGSTEGLVVGALGDLIDAVRDLADVEKDATDAANDARSDWRSAIDEFRQTRNKGAADVADTRRDRDKNVREANIDVTKTRSGGAADVRKAQADGAEKVAAAEKKLTEARQTAVKTGADRVKRSRAIAEAEAARDKEKAARDKAVAAARADAARDTAKAESTLSRARSQGNETVRRATAEANKANAATLKKVDAEKRQYQAAERARKAAEARASEAEADLRRTARARQVLTALGRAADGAARNFQDARSKLDDLKGDRQSLISSIAGTLSGYNGGILGNAEQRRTPADVLRGLTFQAGKVQDFGADLAALKKGGLSAALLQQIAESGVDGGAGTADALAKATPAMLRQINAAAARTNTAAVRGATTVADAVTAKAIAAQLVQTRQMTRVLQEINSSQRNLAGQIGDEFDKIVGAIGADELALLVKRGQTALRRRGVRV